MQKWARLENGVVVETFSHPTDPTPLFDPSWTWVSCPEEAVQGSTKSASTWSHPTPPTPQPGSVLYRKKISPPEFFDRFSADEEVAIREFAAGETATAKLVAVFLRRLDDPRLTYVDLTLPTVTDGLALLVSAGLLAQARADEIALGIPET